MRAISSFSLEAGTSTFWCRARIALRIRASISATGSVKFIFYFSSNHPFSPPQRRTSDGLQRQTSGAPLVPWCPILNFAHFAKFRVGRRNQNLPGSLSHSRNLPAQRQPTEAQSAQPKLPQIRPWTSANLAAVMPPGRELRPSLLLVARLLELLLN